MEIVGTPPTLAGLACEAFICEGFVHNRQPVADANVVYLCFAGVWRKLVLDCGVIIWRQLTEDPKPRGIDHLGFQYPTVDLGILAGVLGHALEDYRMESNSITAEVAFSFENGRTIIINNANDRSTWRITLALD